MKKKLSLILEILFLFTMLYCPWARSDRNMLDSLYLLNKNGAQYFYEGDFIKTELNFKNALKANLDFYKKDNIWIGKAYNNLGVLYINKWEYDSALIYLNQAQKIYSIIDSTISLANTYSNIGNIYHHKGDYENAIQFYNQALNTLANKTSKIAAQRKAEIYNRYALVEINRKNYSKAIELANKGIWEYKNGELQINQVLHTLYTTIAEAYSLNDELSKSLAYLKRSNNLTFSGIDNPDRLKSVTYKKLAQLYLKHGKYQEALSSIKSAETIFKSSSIDSTFYFDILNFYGLYYTQTKEFKKAINSFNQANKLLLKKNGEGVNKYASNIKAIALLKGKANSLYKWYKTDNKSEHIIEAITDLKLATQLIDYTRNGHLSLESKLFLAENESNIYNRGLYLSELLFKKSQKTEYLELAFYFSEKGKSSVLLASLNEEEAKTFAGIPEELLAQESKLKKELAFYKEKLYIESLKPSPDSIKLANWNKYLFDFKRKHEEFLSDLEQNYPHYYQFKYQNTSMSIKDVQSILDKNTSLIEYTLSDSNLYIFTINKKKAALYKQSIDSNFTKHINSFLHGFRNFNYTAQGQDIFQDYQYQANTIYKYLFKQLPQQKLNEQLIIIPDGIISYLPFEALVCTNKTNASAYKDLDYLLYKHSIYYAYSASLLKESMNYKRRKIWNKLLAVAPEYAKQNKKNNNTEASINNFNYRGNLSPLPFAKDEAESIARITHGSKLLGKDATEENFTTIASNYDILHLAMHTVIDDNNPLFSKLVFYNKDNLSNKGFLNTNEIYSLKLNAQITVLSACSSGEGEIKKGEGVMSLARGFFYAGCPSLIMTLWKVEDKSGLLLMQSFYRYLLKGYSKSKALQKAKIDYINTALPQNNHPFFWSSYIIIGNPSAIYLPKSIFLIGIALIILAVFFIVYRKRKAKQIKKN